MARRVVLFLLVCLVGTSVCAQSRLQVGASAGLTAAIQNDHALPGGLSANSDPAYLFAPTISMFMVRPVTSWFAARGDVGFVRKGHRREGGDRPDLVEMIRLDMFSFRLTGEVGTALGSELWAYGVLGPRMDVLVGEESEFEADGEGLGAGTTSFQYDEFVFGAVLGGGVRVDVGLGEALQVEALVDQDVTSAYASEDITVRGRAFMLHAGLVF